MVTANPSLSWERLNDVFYRLRTCYNLTWGEEMNLAKYNISLAPFSTAIALYSKDHELGSTNGNIYNAVSFNQSNLKNLEVFSGSGEKIYNIVWDESKNGKVVQFGWSSKECLIVVSENGTIRNYYDFENNFNEFSLGFESESIGVSDVKFYNTGFVARLRNNSFIFINNLDSPYPRLLSFDSPGDETGSSKDADISCWDIVPPTSKYNKNIEILVGLGEKLYNLDDVSLRDSSLIDGPYSFISVCPNNQLVALYSTTTRKVYIVSSDFTRTLNAFQLSENENINDLKWCGNDVVVIVLNNDELKVIGPGDDYLSFYFNSNVYLFTEFDGLRILNNERLEFLSRIPQNTVDIFKIGSTTPSSILLDSIDLRNSNNPTDNITALENIAIIKNSLNDAINNCIGVATEEFDQYWQKKLLKAASFAKSHKEFYNSQYMIEVIENLKILNQIRSYKIGMFLTYQEFEKTDLNILLNNLLLKRKHHFLSIRISEYLNLPLDLIYIDWCCSKIKNSNELNDDSLLEQLLNKLTKIKNISYEKVSRVAYQEGRSNLSIMLINYEPSASKKIPLLIEMEEDELAVTKAEETMNFKVIEYVLFFLQNKLSLSDFLKIINNKRIALAYWEILMKSLNNWYFLKNYYLSFDRKLTIANLNLILGLIGKTEQDLIANTNLSSVKLKNMSSPLDDIKSINSSNNVELTDIMMKFANKKKSLTSTIKMYEELKTSNKDFSDDLKYLKQEVKLVETQESLQKTFTNLNFFGKSIIETLCLLILINNYDSSSTDSSIPSSSLVNKKIKKILKDFKVSEKRYYFLVIEKLSEFKKWTELYSFANSGKSPIGYEPFYKICIKYNAIRQAGLYIDLIGGSIRYTKRIKMYLRVGNFKSASEEAFKNKDLVHLKEIFKLYKATSHPNAVVTQSIEGYIRKLS
ncbi:tethering complex subunit [Saccharomycopsis crataegensis]|uniref:Probable vacuolar protein sorting-associated protein 16 homolog n=1 Tax=Saccharomycopsis crataegensis TaxID=43959 RepID=A0AAV5QWI3_9ASCO|nr:tethering complex subunit [Saccharomycopsis crataegensis]